MHRSSVNDDVMSTREAAEVLGVALRTVQLWVEGGVLPAWKTAGGHRRIARAAVERLAQERLGAVSSMDADRLRLLVVEDEPDLLRLYEMMFEDWELPLDLDTATNGFEGLVKLGRRRPHLLVTDLMMPGMDGFRMLEALGELEPPMPMSDVVVITALSEAEVVDRGGLPEQVTLMTKPVAFDRLEMLLRERVMRMGLGATSIS